MPDPFQTRFAALVKSGMLVSEARTQALRECGIRAKHRPLGLGSAEYRAFAADKARRAKEERNRSARTRPA